LARRRAARGRHDTSPRPGADAHERPRLRRSGCRARLTASVRRVSSNHAGDVHMPQLFESETFWAAFSALVAFAALVGGIGGVVIAMLKAGKWRRLQATLNKERKFYEEEARRVTPEPIRLPEESAIERYLSSIQTGLLAIAQLSDEQREKTKDKIRDLISHLRTTHTTLVEALKPFTTNDAKKFFEEFDLFNQNFGALYHAGNIPHDARTHCGDVVRIVDDLASKLEPDTTGAPSERIYKIRDIASSMEYADQELIVPIMTYILSKTEVELSLINSAIRDGDKHKAVWLKERYRFDIENLYQRLNVALTNMTDLASKL
jgi:hypothetical protein